MMELRRPIYIETAKWVLERYDVVHPPEATAPKSVTEALDIAKVIFDGMDHSWPQQAVARYELVKRFLSKGDQLYSEGSVARYRDRYREFEGLQVDSWELPTFLKEASKVYPRRRLTYATQPLSILRFRAL